MLGAFLAEAAKGRSELAFSTAAGSRKDKTDDNLNPNKALETKPLSDGENYLVFGGESRKGRQIKDAYGKYVEKQEFSSYDDKFTFKPTDKGWTVTGPTDPDKDGSYSGPITTRSQDESTLTQRMGFDRQATRLGFKGVVGVSNNTSTKTFDPNNNQVTIEQMKATLPKGTNLDRSDEEIRKAYKKYVKSLMPQN